jgi:hypothetical protein
MDMAKNKGKKKNKRQKVNDVLELILASMEKMSSKLVELEEKLDALRPGPVRQGVGGPRGGPERSTGAGGGRSQPVTKKKTLRKKSSVTGKAVRKKAVTGKKAATRNVTRKKTVTRPAAIRKVASK